jgi:hypothetical protein
VTQVDLRCPVTPRRLFAKIRMGEATIDRSDNTISVACDDRAFGAGGMLPALMRPLAG